MANQESNSRYYDVFLSFRGLDTRHTFTGYLYDALRRKGFNTFMDDEGLQSGDQISPSLVKAIEQSRISIVVLSQNYASSPWCLDELVKIIECMKLKNQLVWPIFYKVAPSDVRHQRNSYGEAMTKHENRFINDFEKVQKWKSALFEVANLKGEHFETGYEYEFIQRIVEMATTKLHRVQLDVGEDITGHQSRIEEVQSLLDIESRNTVCMVGIHGTGGIGKTTLAKALYNLIVDQFECAIFLDNVRERSKAYMGLVHLQEAILCKLFRGENIKLGSVDEGSTILKHRLCHMRVLLVLDDVNSEELLEKLAGKCNWFGSGSRVIITTRDKHVLNVHRVEKRYEMKGLNYHEALHLFCRKAFKMSQPATNYKDVSNRAVRYANGLPLALKVIGSNLASKSVRECECALEQYERIPERKIHDILKISYDCLQDNEKHVFLDIACFFNGKSLEYVEKVLQKCDFFPSYNIRMLVDKSLLTVENRCLKMHDLIKDMGREVVRQEASSKPGERSRLYFYEDVLRVLTENSGSSNIEGIILDPPEEEEVEWSGTAFGKMKNLRILIVRNARFSSGPKHLPNSLRLLDWDGYPSESFPPGFCPRNVVVLSLPNGHLRLEKEKPFLKLMHLTQINFSCCQFMTHLPDMSRVPNLRRLYLQNCENLIAVHHSVGFLKKLETLSASECCKLRNFPPRIWLPSLVHLNLNSTSIELFPDVEGMMNEPLHISLENTRIKELPYSVVNLTGLKSIRMLHSNSLRDLPSNFFMLPKITALHLDGSHKVRESFKRFANSYVVGIDRPCYSHLQELYFSYGGLTDEDLHFILGCFPNLEVLKVLKNNFVSLPTSIKGSAHLRVLDVSDNAYLQKIPELPLSIQKVFAVHCPSLSSETSRMLWSKAAEEVYNLEVVMPRAQTEIPAWFDHQRKGAIVSFWVRRKFPVVTLAFIFKAKAPRFVNLDLFIGPLNTTYGTNCPEFVGDHVLLCDLRCLIRDVQRFDSFLMSDSEWTYVEVECYSGHGGPVSVTECVAYWGAYVCKKQTNMEDIQFTCPNPLAILDIRRNRGRLRRMTLESGGGKDKRKPRSWWNTGY